MWRLVQRRGKVWLIGCFSSVQQDKVAAGCMDKDLRPCSVDKNKQTLGVQLRAPTVDNSKVLTVSIQYYVSMFADHTVI